MHSRSSFGSVELGTVACVQLNLDLHRKSFERDASTACFSSIFLKIKLDAARSARLNSIYKASQEESADISSNGAMPPFILLLMNCRVMQSHCC